MSESKPDNRMRLMITLAVLVGALILLLATEWGAILGRRGEAPVPPPASTPAP